MHLFFKSAEQSQEVPQDPLRSLFENIIPIDIIVIKNKINSMVNMYVVIIS